MDLYAGVGALLAPLVSTQFSKNPSFWSFFYIVSTGIAIFNLICLLAVFRLKGKERKLPPALTTNSKTNMTYTIECLVEEGERRDHVELSGNGQVHWKQILTHPRSVLLVAVFLLSYVGTEVTEGSMY